MSDHFHEHEYPDYDLLRLQEKERRYDEAEFTSSVLNRPRADNRMAKTEIEERLGGYNEMPPNWEAITESEFLWKFSVGPSISDYASKEFRQVQLQTCDYGGNIVLRYCNVHFWVYPDYSGIGFVVHYNGHATRSAEDAYHAQWFKFHWCEHEFETTHTANCYWEGKCKKCGYVKAVDSSD